MVYPTLWRSPNGSALWDNLFTTRRELDRVLDRFVTGDAPTAATVWAPVVDIRETADEIRVLAELPGLEPEHVDVSIENNVLTIAGEKKHEVEEGKEDGAFHLIERRYGRFERSFTLPRTVDADAISARFENGVLTVTLPKAEAAKPRRVQVQAGEGTRRIASK